MYTEQVHFDLTHIQFWYGKLELEEDLTIAVKRDKPQVVMVYSLTSNFLLENYGGGNEILSFSHNQHNLLCSPPVQGTLSMKAAPAAERFEIWIDPAFLLQHLPDPQLFDNFRNSAQSGGFALLSAYHLPVTAEMKVLLQDIRHCQKSPSFKKMYVEARIIELLMLQFEQYEQIAGNVICNTLRKTDIQKMHEVRNIIDNSWKEPCSLIDLAQKVTTNEYNLKKSFKEVFGTTIFGYLNDVKMKEARRLLLSGEKNIAEVADMVGYKNPNHFTTAFKKYFGFVPSELK